MKGKFWRKALAVATSVLMLSGGVPFTPLHGIFDDMSVMVNAETAVTYLDASGVQQIAPNYTTVSSDTTSWNSGWYVVSSSTTINNRISVSGTVNLILCNGATLTASNGIGVGSDATFNVYSQSKDVTTMGALTATVSDTTTYFCCAGIGGGNNSNFGTININGGKITATGHNSGIGGGYGSDSGDITINGGIVVANAGDYSNSAGIGGGNNGYVSSITLNGGTISATGDTQYGGAGIGTGAYAGNGTMTITITSGVKQIIATKGNNSDCIGKGLRANTTVNVVFEHNNTEVTGDAKNSVFYDSGEGASSRTIRGNVTNHSITISNNIKANVTANTAAAPVGETIVLTLGTAVDASTLRVNDGISNLTLTNIGNRQYTFVMPNTDVTVTASAASTYSVTLPANMEIVSATNEADGDGKYVSGTTVTFKASYPLVSSNVSDGTNTLTADSSGNYCVTIGNSNITITATTQRSATIDLSDAPGDFNAINNDVLTGSTSHTVTIAGNAKITLSDATINGGIVCEGTAEITLVGTNSVTGAEYKAGIQVGGSGTTLTIKGDGSLTATGNHGGAGIGTGVVYYGDTYNGGSITIIGGSITATGAEFDSNNHSGGNGIGTGYTYADATNTIGTITITTDINIVDASSISGTVVYKYGENNVTASKAEYFTIIEAGDRRVITQKDDTNYIITIADGIEHGTITGATTAKYGDKVTITATPDFGYHLSSLVVKDAQNNDVASTGNSFFMPKSNVTVSAVFEQGTHGTTEFKCHYYGLTPQDYREESIYDGVTTVSLQTGDYYSIIKYEGESFATLLIDNDEYRVNIPYSGGTGSFVQNGTTFCYDGAEGFYDITMTDAGNGKWGVSILKTVGVLDDVPDQTYTGSEITPEPLVLAGSLNLTKGTDYVYSYTNNTNAGTATVRATFQGDYASLGSVEKEFNIVRATPTVTAPTANTLTYNGGEQELVTAGSTNFGKVLYSLDGTNYSEEVPKGTSTGEYTVYYKVEGSDNWNAVEPQTVTAKIGYSDGIGEHLAGHSLSLNGNIGVNFYMELDADVIADPDAYMLFTLPNDTTQTVKVTDATVDTTTISGKTYYVFQCSVAAKEMTDTIKAQMFSGEKQGEEYSYTVKQYADYLFANAYEADGTTVKNQAYVDAIELIKSMVNYGAYSQLYFNHNIDSLANADITDTDVSGVTAETVNKTYDGSTNTLPDGVTLAGANLELESETVMNLYFTNTTGKALTFTTSGNVALVQEQSGEYTKVTITGIAAQYLDSDVTVNVALEGDDNAYSVKYSPMNYCYNVLARETTATRTEALKDVMRAFYLYNKEAKAYFASHNN